MIDLKINWEAVQNRLSACRYMNDAGESNKAKAMLREFAQELLDKTDVQHD